MRDRRDEDTNQVYIYIYTHFICSFRYRTRLRAKYARMCRCISTEAFTCSMRVMRALSLRVKLTHLMNFLPRTLHTAMLSFSERMRRPSTTVGANGGGEGG